MSNDPAIDVIEAFITEARESYKEHRWQKSATTAASAVQAAKTTKDPFMILRALYFHRRALWMMADFSAALVLDTESLAVAEQYASSTRIGGRNGAWYIAQARANWVQDILAQTSDPEKLRQLLEVIDDGERWLVARGFPAWRSGLLLHRSRVLSRIGENDKAIDAAEEALQLAERLADDDPSYTIGDHKVTLAGYLRTAKRESDAAAIYQSLLDNPHSATYERVHSHYNLGEIALDEGRVEDGLRHATQAVEIAEHDEDYLVVCSAMYTLVRALQLAKEMDKAHQAAIRYEERARASRSSSKLYFALRSRFDVEFALGNREQAKDMLPELEKIATALDREEGKAIKATEVARRYERMADQ